MLITMTHFTKENIIFKRESPYHQIVVSEKAGVRYLKFGNNIVQSAVNYNDPFDLKLEYTKYLPLAIIFNPEGDRLLTIGLGGGVLPLYLHRYFPEIEIKAVEIDPAVVEIAKEYFLPSGFSELNITVADGRIFLMNFKQKFDFIVLDAYNENSIPFHLTTIEFLKLVKSRLTENGVVASNIWNNDLYLYKAMLKTFENAFKIVYCFRVLGKNNVIVIGSSQKLSKYEIIERAVKIQNQRNLNYDFVFCARQLITDNFNLKRAELLSDDQINVD